MSNLKTRWAETLYIYLPIPLFQGHKNTPPCSKRVAIRIYVKSEQPLNSGDRCYYGQFLSLNSRAHYARSELRYLTARTRS